MILLDRFRRHDEAPPAQAPKRTAVDCRKERDRVLSVYSWCLRGSAVIFALALVFTMVNVQIFGAAGSTPGSDLNGTFHWVTAWFLDPMASLALVVAVVLGGLLARYGKTSAWLTAVKWFSGLGTWAMNIWPAIDHPHPSGLWAGVLLHSIAPGLVLLGAEAIPWIRLQMTEITDALEREARAIEAAGEAERRAVADQLAAEKQAEIDARNEETRRIRAEQDAARKQEAADRDEARKRADAIALAEAQKAASDARAEADRAKAEADQAEAEKLAQRAAVAAARGPRSKTDRTGSADRKGGTGRTGRTATPPDVTDLLPAGRIVADRLAGEGASLTRSALLAGLRSDGESCSTDRAGALLDLLNDERSTSRSEQRSVPDQAAVHTTAVSRSDTADRPRLSAVANR